MNCNAPVFEGHNWLVCLLQILLLPLVALAFVIAIIVGAILGIFFPRVLEQIICNYKKYLFRVRNCQKGNSDPNIQL